MTCKNCGEHLLETDEYCSNCGAKVIRNRLTLKNLFEHLSETFFNYDNKLLRTFVALFTKPEEVIGGYISGVRKKYVNPISLFGLALTINGLQLFFINKFLKNEYLTASMAVNEQQQNTAANEKIMSLVTGITFDYASLIFSLTIPIFALIALVLFYKKHYNYTEHTIVCLYSFSLYSLAAAIFGLITLSISAKAYFYFGIIIYALFFLYNIYMYKRLFKLSMRQILLKSFLFLIIVMVLFLAIILLLTVLMFVTGYLNPEDFKPKS